MAIPSKIENTLDIESRLTLVNVSLISINGKRHLQHAEAAKGKFSAEGDLQVSLMERNGEQVVSIVTSSKTIGTTTKGRKKNVPVFELEIAMEGIFEINKSANIKTLEDISDTDAFNANAQINPLLVTAINQNLSLMGFGAANIPYKIDSFSSAE